MGLALLVAAVAAGAAAARGRPELNLLDLDAELNVPAFASAAVLLAAALATWILGRRGRISSALGLAGLLLLMAGDELLQLHEQLEQALGIDWQLLYAPVMIAGVVAWTLLLRSLRARHGGVAVLLLVLAAGAWGTSQVLEWLQWDSDEQRVEYRRMMVVEELGELTGSSLFLLAALAMPVARAPATVVDGQEGVLRA